MNYNKNRLRDEKGRFIKQNKVTNKNENKSLPKQENVNQEEKKVQIMEGQEVIDETVVIEEKEETKEDNLTDNNENSEKTTEEINDEPVSKKAKKKKKKASKFHLFSKPLFKENFKSHKRSLLIAGIGNALIMVVIIGILSGLNINATSKSLSSLFGNADTESTVKSGVISLYSAFEGGAEGFDTFKSGEKTLESSLETILEMPSNSTTQTQIEGLKVIYLAKYYTTTGSNEVKHLAAKESALAQAKKSLADKSEEEQMVALTIINEFFEEYHKDSSLSNQTLLQNSVKKCLPSIFINVLNIKDENDQQEITTILNKIYTDYNDSSNKKSSVLKLGTLDLMKFAATDSQKEYIANLSNELKEAYLLDEDKYLSDESIENNILKDNIIDIALATAEDFAYLNFLPDFTVNYYTSVYGYPITYVPTGDYNDDGTPIEKMIEVKTYNPEVFISKDAKMGTVSTLVEKLHKEAITGVAYTEEEINLAKEDSKSSIQMLKDELTKFMDVYLLNYDNYHVSGSLNLELIKTKAVNIVEEMAKVTLVNDYNETHDKKITDVSQITYKEFSMNGDELMQYVRSYAYSGISSYESIYEDSIKMGYTIDQSMIIATSKGSLGVINQLPDSIQDSLTEMGDMNTYGIIVGVIGFSVAVVLIPMVYTILTANSLVSEKIETGSLAFTMSTPISRQSFIYTSGTYLVFTEVLMGVFLTAIACLAQVIGGYCGSGDLLTSLPIEHIVLYGLGNLCVNLAISGICFLSSCWFNKTSDNIGVSGGISIFFYICTILGLFATKAIPGTIRIETMNIFNYLTIFTLFDPLAVMSGDYFAFFMKLIVLLAIAIVCYIVGSIKFNKKDLPL